MDGNRVIDGQFWLAGKPENKRPGTLELGPGVQPSLEILGELSSLMREVQREGSTVISEPAPTNDESVYGPFVIHGVDSAGAKITVLDAIVTTWHMGLETTQQFRGAQAVIGLHLSGREHCFNGIRLRLQHAESWRSLIADPTWTSNAPLKAGGQITFESPFGRRVWLAANNIGSYTLRELGRSFERPLVSLFSLVTESPCDILDLQVQDKTSHGSWSHVYTSSIQQDTQVSSSPAWLLEPSDLNAANIAAWLNRVDLLGPLPHGVADLARINTISIETQVLQLTTIAEGLHRALYPRQKRFAKTVTKQVQKLSADAVAKDFPELADSVKGLLGFLHQPSYSERLERLEKETAASVPGATGDTDKWRRLVTKARNQYSHRLKNEFLKPESVDQYLTTASSLRWLLTGLLLLQADIPPQVLAERFEAYEQYNNFLSSAAEWQPDIYP
jgi:hypothetical protein